MLRWSIIQNHWYKSHQWNYHAGTQWRWIHDDLFVLAQDQSKKDGRENTSPVSEDMNPQKKTKVSFCLQVQDRPTAEKTETLIASSFLRKMYLLSLRDNSTTATQHSASWHQSHLSITSIEAMSSSLLLLLDLICATPTSFDENDIKSVVLQSCPPRGFECCSRLPGRS